MKQYIVIVDGEWRLTGTYEECVECAARWDADEEPHCIVIATYE